jgi:o-succinylbenzoate synthase
MIDGLLESFSSALRADKISPREWLMDTTSVSLLNDFPAVRFGIETAIRDLETGGNRLVFPSSFTDGTYGIPINGLIWMGDPHNMLEQISRKLDAGFRIIKLKVGALAFRDELEVLETVRSDFSTSDLEIRLDANGAWSPAEALEKMTRLAAFGIHSLEQPIAAGNLEEMARVCAASPIPIALDEELIGVWKYAEMRHLLEVIRPAYIILKPSLLGGLERSKSWIDLAGKLKIGWWITSALESNIGLNAIAQWTASLDPKIPQGLGVGTLYSNNLPSPLEMKQDRLWHLPEKPWELHQITKR